MNLKNIITSSCVVLLCLSCFPSYALKDDNKQPATVKADSIEINRDNHIELYQGNVNMQQGSTTLTANNVTIHRDDKNQLETVTAVGKLAHYHTLTEPKSQPLDAYAQTIEYLPKKQKVLLIGSGKITQNGTSFSSAYIVYDIKRQTLKSHAAKGHQTVIVLNPSQLPKR